MTVQVDRTLLTGDEWSQLLRILRQIKGIRIGSEAGCRSFVEAVLWILRVGGQWRSLPAERGYWNSVFKRYARWNGLKVWPQLLEIIAQQADLQDVSIDSSVVRAHACAAGAANSEGAAEALGRSKGGFSCKIHLAVDALGMPLKLILTGGQAADITQAIPLVEAIGATACLADKGYDADAFINHLTERGIKVVIPPKANRKEPRECDFWHYKERHVVECTFGKLKYYRRIATRYDKKAINFMGLLAFACCLLWLR
jgi:transposase